MVRLTNAEWQNKVQVPETQHRPFRKYANRRGFVLAAENVDTALGTTEKRTQYRTMIGATRKRQIDVVLVWRYDRLARLTQALVNSLKEFQSLGIDFNSHQENINTTTPTGELIFHMMASLAHFKSCLTSERVRAYCNRKRDRNPHGLPNSTFYPYLINKIAAKPL